MSITLARGSSPRRLTTTRLPSTLCERQRSGVHGCVQGRPLLGAPSLLSQGALLTTLWARCCRLRCASWACFCAGRCGYLWPLGAFFLLTWHLRLSSDGRSSRRLSASRHRPLEASSSTRLARRARPQGAAAQPRPPTTLTLASGPKRYSRHSCRTCLQASSTSCRTSATRALLRLPSFRTTPLLSCLDSSHARSSCRCLRTFVRVRSSISCQILLAVVCAVGFTAPWTTSSASATHGVDCERRPPATMVIGPLDLYEWARPYVFDFRRSPAECAVALDYRAPLKPTLNAKFFSASLLSTPTSVFWA